MSAFDGFSPDAWRFLDLLTADNSARCFDRHGQVYQSAIAAPSRALVETLVPRVAAEVHSALTGEAKVGRSLFRISDALRARPSRPYLPDAANADLLCRDGFHLSRVEPHPPAIAGSAFVDWLVERLRPYGDLIELVR